MTRPVEKMMQGLYPEIGAGGYSRDDSTVEFYNRVNALLPPSAVVVDLGAGRGRRFIDDPVMYRRELARLRGKCSVLIGTDVDRAIAGNPGLDAPLVVGEKHPLPFRESSVDVVYSDFVLEHVRFPDRLAEDIHRVLKPGGWLCARTPNRYGYIALAARLLPRRLHRRVLRRVQPQRSPSDVFPAQYLLCTRRQLDRYFPRPMWENFSYIDRGEVHYVGASKLGGAILKFALAHCPESLGPMWLIFLRKR